MNPKPFNSVNSTNENLPLLTKCQQWCNQRGVVAVSLGRNNQPTAYISTGSAARICPILRLYAELPSSMTDQPRNS